MATITKTINGINLTINMKGNNDRRALNPTQRKQIIVGTIFAFILGITLLSGLYYGIRFAFGKWRARAESDAKKKQITTQKRRQFENYP
jgi:hypothetical protein